MLIDGLRRLGGARRLARVFELRDTALGLAAARLREGRGDLPSRELQLRLASLWLDRETMRRVFGWPEDDVLVLTRDALLVQEMARRQQHAVADGSDERAYFASPEDTILQKLAWYRRGQELSDRQWRDVIGVLEVQGTSLDVAYLRHWAAPLAVEDLLERAMAEAGLHVGAPG